MKPQLQVGQNIRKWREFKGYKQQTLARHLSVSKATISNIENDKTDISLHRMEAIAHFLGVEMYQLFTTPQQFFSEDKVDVSPDSNPNSFNKETLQERVQQLKQEDEIINGLEADREKKSTL
ncbi:MAG: helix-turn-helix transcriptional regulator [Flavisolibacter sp.]|nr:helix-turn-helix transcriptional regulator [Flavisolibacter sp.]MBD0377981.1 helix-turn-helix transcriptional regulator [Flavisolibacter sp.]